jgi:hypothetical protein
MRADFSSLRTLNNSRAFESDPTFQREAKAQLERLAGLLSKARTSCNPLIKKRALENVKQFFELVDGTTSLLYPFGEILGFSKEQIDYIQDAYELEHGSDHAADPDGLGIGGTNNRFTIARRWRAPPSWNQ